MSMRLSRSIVGEAEAEAVQAQIAVFGAGHVGRALAPVLHYIGFEVTVYDNRAELASPAHFPTAHEIVVGDFRRIFDTDALQVQLRLLFVLSRIDHLQYNRMSLLIQRRSRNQ